MRKWTGWQMVVEALKLESRPALIDRVVDAWDFAEGFHEFHDLRFRK
jgi:hypothetical protein